MLWNWNTVDTCFISKAWHITSAGMFAGSCIGVICLVICLELLRRIAREYDAFIVHRARLHADVLTVETVSNTRVASSSNNTDNDNDNGGESNSQTSPTTPAPNLTPTLFTHRPTILEQLVRAALYTVQFAVAYFVMLLAMYYNGYIIICIFVGAFIGAFVFSWEVVVDGRGGFGYVILLSLSQVYLPFPCSACASGVCSVRLCTVTDNG
ncbi:Ctr-domain-containing protein [Aspergillus ellipticus CBS 707.79]|uniref:Copper transport protein n=1 Tax=Aspergillus ellipticus CBS 707.79 TaxID=1448320 RepID=A0A319DWC1_9EURO|nr:Ctr-domain-containing protein [Aspergillus ellipticus CBS 707.79]